MIGKFPPQLLILARFWIGLDPFCPAPEIAFTFSVVLPACSRPRFRRVPQCGALLIGQSAMVGGSVLHSRILIAGAGALGSVYGCFFRRAGYPVTLLGRTAHLDAIAASGLHIEGLWGEHHATGFDLITDATQAKTPFDAILISAKSCDTDAIAPAIAPVLAGDGVAISLQNGLGNVEKIAAQVGWERALAARVIFGAEVLAPGRVRVTVYADPVLIGVWQDGPGPHLEAAARRWAERFAAAGIPAAYCDDIKAALWGKVLYNAALNPLSALLGVHVRRAG